MRPQLWAAMMLLPLLVMSGCSDDGGKARAPDAAAPSRPESVVVDTTDRAVPDDDERDAQSEQVQTGAGELAAAQVQTGAGELAAAPEDWSIQSYSPSASGETMPPISAGELPAPGSALELDIEEFLHPRNWMDGIPPDGCSAALEGVFAYYLEDYATAYTHLVPLATDGDACAQYYVGRRYDAGRDVAVDLEEAAYWYRLSAAQGFVRSQYNLGVLLARHQVADADPEVGARLYLAAAKRGHPMAMNNLGALFECGCGLPLDLEEATMWYGLAALQGLPMGMINFERMAQQLENDSGA